MTIKNYYSILGVTVSAEDIVIRAAYRALAQRYHPDKYSGRREDAEEKMKEINGAFSVLSDPVKRSSYDKDLFRNKTTQDSYDDDVGDENDISDPDIAAAWTTAISYYPDLVTIKSNLSKIARRLAYSFQLAIVTNKAYEQRVEIATRMRRKFLEVYFTTNDAYINFAEHLITHSYKEAARELNKAVSVLGDNSNPNIVISTISSKFSIPYQPSPHPTNSASAPAPSASSSGLTNAEKLRLRGEQDAREWRSMFIWSVLIFFVSESIYSLKWTGTSLLNFAIQYALSFLGAFFIAVIYYGVIQRTHEWYK